MNENYASDISNKILALLFAEAGPIRKKYLQEIFSLDFNKLQQILTLLENMLKNSSLTLVQTDNEVALRVKKEYTGFLSNYYKKQQLTSLGESSYEVLSIILYLGKANKAEIDYIRGINSSSSLKKLLLKGYIKKQKDSRKTYYIPTVEALSYLGISKPSEMPEYSKIRTSLLELLGRAYENQ